MAPQLFSLGETTPTYSSSNNCATRGFLIITMATCWHQVLANDYLALSWFGFSRSRELEGLAQVGLADLRRIGAGNVELRLGRGRTGNYKIRWRRPVVVAQEVEHRRRVSTTRVRIPWMPAGFVPESIFQNKKELLRCFVNVVIWSQDLIWSAETLSETQDRFANIRVHFSTF